MIVEQVWTGNAYRNFNYLIVCPEIGEAMAVDPLDHRSHLRLMTMENSIRHRLNRPVSRGTASLFSLFLAHLLSTWWLVEEGRRLLPKGMRIDPFPAYGNAALQLRDTLLFPVEIIQGFFGIPLAWSGVGVVVNSILFSTVVWSGWSILMLTLRRMREAAR